MFLVDNRTSFQLNPTPKASAAESAPGNSDAEDLLAEAVARLHVALWKGMGDQTISIMREMLRKAIDRTRRKFKSTIRTLVVFFLVVSAYDVWKLENLERETHIIDSHILDLEKRLDKLGINETEADGLLARLDRYENQAKALQNSLLYRVGMGEQRDPVLEEIKALLAEFGAETYKIPPEFLEQVHHFIEQYQGPDRELIEYGLGRARADVNNARRVFQQEHLPPDLAYLAIVESALDPESSSLAGAAGLWQFTAATARAYGLIVDDDGDERLNTPKATNAACKYIRELILDFGAGSSVMLALAAYNVGPAKVKQAVREVSDPIKQRNFWYLYRVRALPNETRNYVPKVIAVIIIARHPERFGF